MLKNYERKSFKVEVKRKVKSRTSMKHLPEMFHATGVENVDISTFIGGVQLRYTGGVPMCTPTCTPTCTNGIYLPSFYDFVVKNTLDSVFEFKDFNKLNKYSVMYLNLLKINKRKYKKIIDTIKESQEKQNNQYKRVITRYSKDENITAGTYLKFLSGDNLILGFDTEWYEKTDAESKEIARVPITAQFYTEIDGIEYEFLFKDFTDDKLKLFDCLYFITNDYFKDFGITLDKRRKKHHKTDGYSSTRVTLVSHFGGVDLSLCDDFNMLFNFVGLTREETIEFNDAKRQLNVLINSPDFHKKEIQEDVRKLRARIKSFNERIGRSEQSKNVIVQNKHVVFTTSPRKIPHWVRPYHYHCLFEVDLRDTMSLCAPGTSLASLGEALSLEKLDTLEIDRKYNKPLNYFKTHMNELYALEPDFYRAYAMRDAEISYKWYKDVILKEVRDGVTISQIASRLLREGVRDAGRDYDELRGLVKNDKDSGLEEEYSKMLGRGMLPDDLIQQAFMGGLNACYTNGFVSGKTFDLDLKSAYILAICAMPEIDYSQPATIYKKGHVFTLEDFEGDFPMRAGFGHVSCEFPSDVKHPTLGVRLHGAPTFLQSFNEGVVNLCEVYTAVLLGARVEVTKTFYVPAIKNNFTPISDVMAGFVHQRNEYADKYGKKSALALMQKIINNSIYGKFGQGVTGKNVQDFLTGDYKEVEESSITDGVMACTVTSFIRAVLGLTINYIHREGFTVHSVTTDGFITDFPDSRLNELSEALYEHVPELETVVKRLFNGDNSVLEVKHENDGFYNIKTRGNVGVNDTGVFAKAGFRGDDNFRFSSERVQRDNFIDLYVNRDGKVTDLQNNMNNLYNIKEGNVKGLTKLLDNPNKYISLDADDKHFPVSFNGQYIETMPHKDVFTYSYYREQLRVFYSLGHNLRDERDIQSLQYVMQGYKLPTDKKTVPLDKNKNLDSSVRTTKEIKDFKDKLLRYELRQLCLCVNYPKFHKHFNTKLTSLCNLSMSDLRDLVIQQYPNVSKKLFKNVWDNTKAVTRKGGTFAYDHRTAIKVLESL